MNMALAIALLFFGLNEIVTSYVHCCGSIY